MGGKSSKPLRDSARTVLARRQVPTPNDPPSHTAVPISTPSIQHADMPHVSSKSIPLADEKPEEIPHIKRDDEPKMQSSSTMPRPPSSSDFNNPTGAPLPPDLLAAISKWQVRKKVAALPSEKVANSIEPVRFRSTAEIRQQKDLELTQREEQGLPLIGRLTEMQLHDFYKIVRDRPDISPAEIAGQFHLTENMAQLLLEVARLPVIVRSDDKTESVAI